MLRPGATADWSIHVPASTIGMTTFGVYPVAAQAEDQYRQSRSRLRRPPTCPTSRTGKGPYASPRPTPAKIAWLWPLIDTPQLNEPWQGNCSGAQASALAQSLGPGGRLAELARVGATDQDVTWVIDPAVLANVRALTTCQSTQPRWAKAASVWLADLQSDTSGRPLTVTPYGDPNAAALFDVGHGADVNRSYDLGRALGSAILGHRILDPGASGGTSGTVAPLTQAAGIAWSATGVPGYPTLEQLANVDSVCTLVLSSSAFPGGQYSVLKTLDGGGSGGSCGTYMTALLASQSLTQLLGSTASGPGSAFSTSQQFLAETALLAQASPGAADRRRTAAALGPVDCAGSRPHRGHELGAVAQPGQPDRTRQREAHPDRAEQELAGRQPRVDPDHAARATQGPDAQPRDRPARRHQSPSRSRAVPGCIDARIVVRAGSAAEHGGCDAGDGG